MKLNREILNQEFRQNANRIVLSERECSTCLVAELEKVGLINENTKKTFALCYEYAYFLHMKACGLSDKSKRQFQIEMEDKFGLASEGVRWTIENNLAIVQHILNRLGEKPRTKAA